MCQFNFLSNHQNSRESRVKCLTLNSGSDDINIYLQYDLKSNMIIHLNNTNNWLLWCQKENGKSFWVKIGKNNICVILRNWCANRKFSSSTSHLWCINTYFNEHKVNSLCNLSNNIFKSEGESKCLEKGKGQPNFIVISKLQLICKLYLIPIATGNFLKLWTLMYFSKFMENA